MKASITSLIIALAVYSFMNGGCNKRTDEEPPSIIHNIPVSFHRIPSTYSSGGWTCTVLKAPNSDSSLYLVRIKFKNKEIKGNIYDRTQTPWGTLIKHPAYGWNPMDWHSLTLEECRKGNDVTPKNAQPVRLATTPTAADTISDCLIAVESPDISVKLRAIGLLGHLASKTETAVTALISILEHTNHTETRPTELIIQTLGRLGPGAKDAMPVLILLGNHEDDRIRYVLVWALFKIDPESETTSEYLQSRLEDQSEKVRNAAASAIAKLKGPKREIQN